MTLVVTIEELLADRKADNDQIEQEDDDLSESDEVEDLVERDFTSSYFISTLADDEDPVETEYE